MNIFVIHAHTANRGDEAAVKAMIDEILRAKPDTKITIAINSSTEALLKILEENDRRS